MSKHTPGPWTLSDDHRVRRVIKGANGHSIVIVEDWTTDADAHLIAAAPDLLHVVELLGECIADGTLIGRGGGSIARHLAERINEVAGKARNESIDHHTGENLPQPSEA